MYRRPEVVQQTGGLLDDAEAAGPQQDVLQLCIRIGNGSGVIAKDTDGVHKNGPVEFCEGPLFRPWEGVGPENLGFLGPNALASLMAISGPKKVLIFRAHPFQWPSKWM